MTVRLPTGPPMRRPPVNVSNGVLPWPMYWPDVTPQVEEAQRVLSEASGVGWDIRGSSVVYEQGAGRMSAWLQLSSMGNPDWGVDGVVDNQRVFHKFSWGQGGRWGMAREILAAVREGWPVLREAFGRELAEPEAGGEWRRFRFSSCGGDGGTAWEWRAPCCNLRGAYVNHMMGQWVWLRVVPEADNDVYKYRILELQDFP